MKKIWYYFKEGLTLFFAFIFLIILVIIELSLILINWLYKKIFRKDKNLIPLLEDILMKWDGRDFDF